METPIVGYRSHHGWNLTELGHGTTTLATPQEIDGLDTHEIDDGVYRHEMGGGRENISHDRRNIYVRQDVSVIHAA